MQEMQERRVRSPGQEDPWRRKWPPTPVLLPGKFHEQRSLGRGGVREGELGGSTATVHRAAKSDRTGSMHTSSFILKTLIWFSGSLSD